MPQRPTKSAARTADRRDPPGVVSAEPPAAPDHLSDDAADVWTDVAGDLARAGVLVESDHHKLAEFCRALAIARRYGQRLEDGMEQGTATVLDRNGNSHEVPFLGSKVAKRLRSGWRQAMQVVQQMAGDFGLDPSSRLRLGVENAAGKSLLAMLREARPDADGEAA